MSKDTDIEEYSDIYDTLSDESNLASKVNILKMLESRDENQVFLGILPDTNEYVIVKSYDDIEAGTKELEALKILAEINDGSFPKILDCDIDEDDKISIITDKFDGIELLNIINEDFGDIKPTQYKKLISAEVLILIFRNIAKVVAKYQSIGMVHNDLKPENILVNIDTYDVCIIDWEFGQKETSPISKSETCLGTLSYISPEMLKNNIICMKGDIWALGIILYVILTHIDPIEGDTDEEKLKNISKFKYNFNFTDVDETIKNIIISCCQIDINNRATIDFVLDELDKCI